MELEEDQWQALRPGSKQAPRIANLLHSINPESFKAAKCAKRMCEHA
jgi:hypothetical protein